MTYDILIVDDEADICQLVSDILKDEGFSARTASSIVQGREAMRTRLPHLVILDVWFERNQVDGLTFLSEIKNQFPELPVVMISGHGTIESAVRAIQKGAYDFLQKPFDADRLILSVRRALEAAQLRRRNKELQAQSELGVKDRGVILGGLKAQLDKIAATGSRVLITGPSGSGKETVARYTHHQSKRHAHPFVVVNCALMAPDRFEAEFFGLEHDTSLKAHNVGFLEQAHGGTLFLAEITDMPYETQGKFVRMLQDNGFMRVGSSRRVEVDVRVMAASTCDLKEATLQGKLREDLFYRLNVVPVQVPSLAERRAEIPELCQFFLDHITQSQGLSPVSLSAEALAALQSYTWPGNVRQLKNVMEWLAIMYSHESEYPLSLDKLPSEITGNSPLPSVSSQSIEIMTMPLKEAREIFERDYLIAQVNRFSGNISRTALFVGMERSALHRKLKTLGAHTVKSSMRTHDA